MRSGYSSFRKLAFGAWKPANDPTTYAEILLPLDTLDPYLKQLSDTTGKRITYLHAVLYAVSACLRLYPALNCYFSGSRFYQRPDVSLFVTTVLRDRGLQDLSGVPLRDLDRMCLADIADVLDHRVRELRSGEDLEIRRVQKILRRLSFFGSKLLVCISDFLIYRLRFPLRLFGLPEDRFGSAVITDVSRLGTSYVYGPLFPFSRTPLTISVGAAKWVLSESKGNDPPSPERVLPLGIAFDHRVFEGLDGARAARFMKQLFRDVSFL